MPPLSSLSLARQDEGLTQAVRFRRWLTSTVDPARHGRLLALE